MKWGVRRYQNKDGTLTRAGKRRSQVASKNLNKKLVRSFKALDEYERSMKVQTISNPASGKPSTFVVSDIKKREAYNRAVNDVNKYMDELDKKGFKWHYDSNYGYTGKLVEAGKGYVKTIIDGQIIETYF